MKRSLVLPIILFSLSSYSHAWEVDHLMLKLDFLKFHNVYESSGIPSESEYEQIFHNSTLRTRSYLGQPGMAIPMADEREETSSVPGIDKEGHSKLKLINIDGKVYLSVDLLEKDTVMGISHLAKYNAEVRFVKGTWEDYQNGRDVTLELTSEGRNTELEHFTKAMKAVAKTMARQLVGRKVGGVAVEGIAKIHGVFMSYGDTIKANLSRIEIQVERMSCLMGIM